MWLGGDGGILDSGPVTGGRAYIISMASSATSSDTFLNATINPENSAIEMEKWALFYFTRSGSSIISMVHDNIIFLWGAFFEKGPVAIYPLKFRQIWSICGPQTKITVIWNHYTTVNTFLSRPGNFRTFLTSKNHFAPKKVFAKTEFFSKVN